MASGGKNSDELPSGWKEFVKVKNGRKIKYFTNSATGQKLYSKKSVLQFVNSQETTEQGASPSTNLPVTESIPCKSEATSDNGKKDESLEWLPSGWTVEYRTRKSGSSTYKIYTDPLTKCKFYSKPQVMQYLKGIEGRNAGGKQQQQIGEETLLKQQEDISQHEESGDGKIPLFVENNNEMNKSLLKDVEENKGLSELPPVHTQEIKTRNRGHGISKGQDTSQASESLEGNNHISGEDENDKDKSSLNLVLYDPQAKNGSDELPPGWIKEIKNRKRGSATKSDPYYIDTASGYAFRSKKDVARYLETGDIRSCAIKPHKWDFSGLKSIKEDTHPSSTHSVNKLEKSATRIQPFVDLKPENECAQARSGAAVEAEKSKGKECDGVSEKSKEKDDGIPAENSGEKVDVSEQDTKILPGNMAAESTNIDGFHEQKLQENSLEAKTKKETRKSRKRKLPSTPGRSSKRLAGHEPEVQPDLRLTERALRSSGRQPDEAEVLSEMAPNTAANEVPQQPVPVVETTGLSSLASSTAAKEVPQLPVTEAETTRPSNLALNPAQADTMAAHHSSVCAEMSLGKKFDINLEAPSDNQVLQQTTGQERQVEDIPMSQGDYFFDPCWDFAFKTLTGAIPLEDTLQGCFGQQTGTSYAQDNLNFGLPEFEIPPIFQNDVPLVDPVQNNAPACQPSTNPTSAPPGNISVPGCNSQPPSLEAASIRRR